MLRPNKLSLALCSVMFSASSQAGGLWLNEFGDFSGGRASAGSQAGVDDASALVHNPASISRLEGSQLQLNGGAIFADIEFDVESTNPINGDGDGGQAGIPTPLGASFYVHDLESERWHAGISLIGLAGSGLEYDDDWVGRFEAVETSLQLLALTPTVAYQLSDKFSLGLGLQFYYATIDAEFAVPSPSPRAGDGRAEIDGSDTGFGFTLGALYEFSPNTRLGISYQSEISPEFDGDLRLSRADLSVATDLEQPFGQYLRVGLHHQVTPKLGLDFTLGWDDWSALDHVLISTENGEAGLDKNWQDTYHYAAGVQYQIAKDWKTTFGIAYDTSPVDSRNRTADLPVDRQVRYAAGLEHQQHDGLKLGGYLIYLDLGDAEINSENWSGDFSDNAGLGISLYANWTF